MPYWDFDTPDIPEAPRDASAAAVAASGLAELARVTGGPRGAEYRRAAEETIASLIADYRTTRAADEAVLDHSVGFLRQDSEVDVGLVYADHYFVEGLLRLRQQ